MASEVSANFTMHNKPHLLWCSSISFVWPFLPLAPMRASETESTSNFRPETMPGSSYLHRYWSHGGHHFVSNIAMRPSSVRPFFQRAVSDPVPERRSSYGFYLSPSK